MTTARTDAEYEWVALGRTGPLGLRICWWRSAEHAEREPANPVVTAAASGVTIGHLVPLHSIPVRILEDARDAFEQLARGRLDIAREYITHHWERGPDAFEIVKGPMP